MIIQLYEIKIDLFTCKYKYFYVKNNKSFLSIVHQSDNWNPAQFNHPLQFFPLYKIVNFFY